MKRLIKRILGICSWPVLMLGMLLPAKKVDKADLRKDAERIEGLHKRKEYLPKKYKNKPVDEKIDLSIIVPVYNVEPYLKECIDSLLANRTKYRFEIIAVNDGSTDGSLGVLKSYKDKRVKVISTENGGLSQARNVGLDSAVGKYVVFVDSDDYVTEDFVEVLMGEAYERGADVVRAGYYVLEDGETTAVRPKGICVEDGLGEKVLECSGFAWGAAIRRELFYNVRFPEGYIFEDMIMRPLILARAKGYAEASECIYYYRQRRGSILETINRTTDSRCLDQYYLVREIYGYGREIGVYERILKIVLFRELGMISYMRIRKLGRLVGQAAFELNAKFVEELGVSEGELWEEVDKLFLKCYERRRYWVYVLSAWWGRLG